MIETNKQTDEQTNKQTKKFHSKMPDVFVDKEILNTSTMPTLLQQTDDW
jgi:hypothetical protein